MHRLWTLDDLPRIFPAAAELPCTKPRHSTLQQSQSMTSFGTPRAQPAESKSEGVSAEYSGCKIMMMMMIVMIKSGSQLLQCKQLINKYTIVVGKKSWKVCLFQQQISLRMIKIPLARYASNTIVYEKKEINVWRIE